MFDGTSLKHAYHFAQVVRSGKLQLFDYGSNKNKELYGTSVPPDYNLKVVTSPIHLYYGTKDGLVSTTGSRLLRQILPNIISSVELPWNHAELLVAEHVDKFVNNLIIQSMIKK